MANANVTSESGNDQPLQPRQQSLLRSSMLMASGTMVSRVLGFIRSAMLIAAIGVGVGVADTFGAANTLPNNVYNLLAAGVFDAVLIPQIVKALRRKNGSVYVNRLLTAAGSILFLLTVLAMIGAPLLITITASGFPPEYRALAITFSLWCLPQIFFYGLYNLLGEVLNARGIFGPYMWAPVVNNIVSIAGLGAFLALWGLTDQVDGFTNAQILVLAGSATLGVVSQALILLIPLRRSGVKLRPDFHFRGTDFGSASKVAGWTFATLMISQLGVLSTNNLASQAVRWGVANNEVVATVPAYSTAFMLYMVPQSLIAVTLATAIFTRLANSAGEGDYVAVAQNYHTGVRLITMLSMLSVAVMLVTAQPLMQLLLPGFEPAIASIYASVLIALVFGIPSTGIILVSQRVFYAFEDAKPIFLMGIIPTALQLLIGWSVFFMADGHWWTVGAAAAETACRVLQGFIAIFWTAHLVRTINAGKIVAQYLLYFIAFVVSALVGWGVISLIGPSTSATTILGRFVDSLWRVMIVAIVICIVYFIMLRLVDRDGFSMFERFARDRMPSRLTRHPSPEATPEAPAEEESALDTMTGSLPLGSLMTMAPKLPAPTANADLEGMPAVPAFDDIIAGEYAARALGRSLSDGDPTSTGQIPLLFDYGNFAEPEAPVTPPPAAPVTPPPVQTPASPSQNKSSDSLSDGYHSTVEDFFITSSERTPTMADDGEQQPPTTPPITPPKGKQAQPKPGAASGGPVKFDPTKPMMILGGVIVVFGLIFSFHTLTSPLVPSAAPSGEQSETTQSESQSTDTDEKTAAPSEKPVPAPKIASVSVFSWSDDGKDHPELASALTDGDADTLWYSRYYVVNEFSDSETIALLVKLKKEALVSEITLNVEGEGGELVVRIPDGDNPRKGEVLTTTTLKGKTVIKLPQPTKLSSIGLSFNQLPTDNEGLYRAQISGISVK